MGAPFSRMALDAACTAEKPSVVAFATSVGRARRSLTRTNLKTGAPSTSAKPACGRTRGTFRPDSRHLKTERRASTPPLLPLLVREHRIGERVPRLEQGEQARDPRVAAHAQERRVVRCDRGHRPEARAAVDADELRRTWRISRNSAVRRAEREAWQLRSRRRHVRPVDCWRDEGRARERPLHAARLAARAIGDRGVRGVARATSSRWRVVLVVRVACAARRGSCASAHGCGEGTEGCED